MLIGAFLTACMAQPPEPAPAEPTAIATAVLTPAPTIAGTRPTADTSMTAQPSRPAVAAEAYLSMPSFARGYLTSPNELRRISALARSGQEPYKSAVEAELSYAEDALKQDSITIPDQLKINDDIDTPRYLSVGAKYVYAWAIAYNLLRDSDPKSANEYASRAREWIIAMPEQNTQVKNYENNTRLNLSVYTQNFVYAADLLADWIPVGQAKPFASGPDAQKLKQWLGAVIVRYSYNAAYTRVNNWGAWARLTTAVIADYVGGAAPLYVQRIVKGSSGAYDLDLEMPCESGELKNCVTVAAAAMYADMIRLHYDMVDGKLYEFSFSSCDSRGSKSMIRPDGGIPDELRREYDCDTTTIGEPYGPAARYSQFAIEAMVSLAEVSWRRGDAGLYTHIDPQTGRGALYRSVQFLIDNHVTLTRGSMLEMVNRFYTYQVGVTKDQSARQEYQKLISADLPGILKRQGEWPEGAGFVSFGTLTHGFAAGEQLRPPLAVRPLS